MICNCNSKVINFIVFSFRAGIPVKHGWPCNGPLLELSENVAQRLVAAFDTTTGMPYGTVHLQRGVPHLAKGALFLKKPEVMAMFLEYRKVKSAVKPIFSIPNPSKY